MRAKRMAVRAASLGAVLGASALMVPGAALAGGLSDALPDVDVHLNVDQLAVAPAGGGTEVTFAPPTAPVNTTCYGPYVYTGKLDSKIQDIAGRITLPSQQGDEENSGTGQPTIDQPGTDQPDTDAAAADEAVDDAVTGATGDTSAKVSPVEADPDTRVAPGDDNRLTFALDDAPYTALATCITGGKVPVAGDEAQPDAAPQPDAADAVPGVHGAVYLRAINYRFGVVGQMLGSLDSGSIGSIGDFGFDGVTGSIDGFGAWLASASE